MRIGNTAAALAAAALLAGGCSSDDEQKDTQPNPFTFGNVQLSIKTGETTQAEILEKFGPPNVATIDGAGQEVWTYQKNATVSKSGGKTGYFTIIILGGKAGNSGFEQTQRTMTLIIKFGPDKKVADFKSMATSF